MGKQELLEQCVFDCTDNLKQGRDVGSSLKWLSRANVPFSVLEKAGTEHFALKLRDSTKPKVPKYANKVLKHLKNLKEKADSEIEEPASKKIRVDGPRVEDKSEISEAVETEALETSETETSGVTNSEIPKITGTGTSESTGTGSPEINERGTAESTGTGTPETTGTGASKTSQEHKPDITEPKAKGDSKGYDEAKVAQMSFNVLESFILQRPQFSIRADKHFEKFVDRDFPDEENKKPEDFTWKAWYNQLREEKGDEKRRGKKEEAKKASETPKVVELNALKRKSSDSSAEKAKKQVKSPMLKIGYMGPSAKIETPAKKETVMADKKGKTAVAAKKKLAPLAAKCQKMRKQYR
uniref:H15 domain-containing protein n=1 Tax=Caenorhabditis tropicalis TaxID=1561998 RepID=A0A1I7TW75_9PELO